MNFEDACREFLRGCSNASTDRPQDCPECLDAFVEKIKKLAIENIQITTSIWLKCAVKLYGSPVWRRLRQAVFRGF